MAAEQPTDDVMLTQLLNERLKRARYDTYDIVNVLGIYWQEAHEGYRDESRMFRRYLETQFCYKDSEEFAIPSEDSHLELEAFIDNSLLKINRQLQQKRSGLLIIHYSGHGDEDSDKAKRQQRRSVWAALSEGGPKVKWYEIQRNLKRTTADVFLVLDCCFAAQVMRGQLSYDDETAMMKDEDRNENVIAVLAASGMTGYTFKPGSRSFSTAFMTECNRMLQENSYVLVSELSYRLGNRDIGTGEPSVIDLPAMINPSSQTIKLHVLREIQTSSQNSLSTVLFKFDVDGFQSEFDFKQRVKALGDWLASNIPSFVANPSVTRVIRSVQISSEILKGLEGGEENLLVGTSKINKADIGQAWKQLANFIKTAPQSTDAVSTHQHAFNVLKELEEANDRLLNTCANHVESHGPANNARPYDTAQRSVLAPMLLKRFIRKPETALHDHGQMSTGTRSPLEERKYYKSSMGPADIEESVRRVELLASVLSSAESGDFRTLPLLSWDHDRTDHCFVLKFAIPERYKDTKWVSLFEVIRLTQGGGLKRPTLEQRFHMALVLSKAVSQWHEAGWVHQSLNSHDIFFFYLESTSELDYSNPYIGGFEYARPRLAPSLGLHVEDLNRDVYRHPKRQGPSREGHRKKHDIYSIGVVLAEIGLWLQASSIAQPGRKKPIAVAAMKEALASVTGERLSFYVGENYDRVVRRCLEEDFDVILDDESESKLDQAFRFLVVDQLQAGCTPVTR